MTTVTKDMNMIWGRSTREVIRKKHEPEHDLGIINQELQKKQKARKKLN